MMFQRIGVVIRGKVRKLGLGGWTWRSVRGVPCPGVFSRGCEIGRVPLRGTAAPGGPIRLADLATVARGACRSRRRPKRVLNT